MELLNSWILDFNSVLWGVFVLIPLLCGTGIFYTIKLRFVQVRLFPTALRFLLNNAAIFGKKADKSGMSSFQALATAVAAQVGTGNVAGAATAIVAGGPGALFWLWVAAFFGMATIFAEAVLAQTYRGINAQGHVIGGPAFLHETRFRRKVQTHGHLFLGGSYFNHGLYGLARAIQYRLARSQ